MESGKEIYSKKGNTDTDGTKTPVTRNEIIDRIEEVCQREFNEKRPILFIGYSQMKRGISFRSERVPTHLIFQMGPRMTWDTVIQAMGRATHMGSEGAEKKKVKVLMTRNDLTGAKAYYNLINYIVKKAKDEGIAISEILKRSNLNEYDDDDNRKRPFKALESRTTSKNNQSLDFLDSLTLNLSHEDEIKSDCESESTTKSSRMKMTYN